jgi:hypothetical protein
MGLMRLALARQLSLDFARGSTKLTVLSLSKEDPELVERAGLSLLGIQGQGFNNDSQ